MTEVGFYEKFWSDNHKHYWIVEEVENLLGCNANNIIGECREWRKPTKQNENCSAKKIFKSESFLNGRTKLKNTNFSRTSDWWWSRQKYILKTFLHSLNVLRFLVVKRTNDARKKYNCEFISFWVLFLLYVIRNLWIVFFQAKEWAIILLNELHLLRGGIVLHLMLISDINDALSSLQNVILLIVNSNLINNTKMTIIKT